jgi:YVTN family beta-propeller protein
MFRLFAMAAPAWLVCAEAQATTLYVTNAGQADGTGSSISVIDANRLKVTATIGLGKSGPYFPALSPDGKFLWVAQYIYDFNTNTCNNSGVSVIRIATLKIEATLPVQPCPVAIAFSLDGRFAYIPANAGVLSVIDTRSRSVVATLPVSAGQNGIATSPDGKLLYVADAGDNNITVVRTGSNRIVRQIALDGEADNVIITHDGRLAFAWVISQGEIEEINLATNRVVAHIPPGVGSNPEALLFSRNGNLLYNVDYYSNTVWVYNPHTRENTGNLGRLKSPIGAALSPNGKLAYVTTNNCPTFVCRSPGYISVVNTATQATKAIVNVGFNTQYVAIAP